MRKLVLLLLCFIITFTASAQLNLNLFRKKRPDMLPAEKPRMYRPRNFVNYTFVKPRIGPGTSPRSAYSLELEENAVMKTAQHNMRFRIYDVASYNFSSLAQLYVKQNRLSEAKWYFLQSNFLSRQQNNVRLTFLNLCKLAMVKYDIGDFVLAQQDLLEARDIAITKGWLIDAIDVEKKLSAIRQRRMASLRTDLRYAEVLN